MIAAACQSAWLSFKFQDASSILHASPTDGPADDTDMRQFIMVIMAILVTLVLTACGQKGPLYLPEAAGTASTAPEQPAPAADASNTDVAAGKTS